MSRSRGDCRQSALRAKSTRSLEALAFEALALKLAGPSDSFRLFAGPSFGWLLVGSPQLHFPENAFALHLLL